MLGVDCKKRSRHWTTRGFKLRFETVLMMTPRGEDGEEEAGSTEPIAKIAFVTSRRLRPRTVG